MQKHFSLIYFKNVNIVYSKILFSTMYWTTLLNVSFSILTILEGKKKEIKTRIIFRFYVYWIIWSAKFDLTNLKGDFNFWIHNFERDNAQDVGDKKEKLFWNMFSSVINDILQLWPGFICAKDPYFIPPYCSSYPAAHPTLLLIYLSICLAWEEKEEASGYMYCINIPHLK